MASSSFDNLVAKLSAEERGILLERIKMAVPASSEPLFPASSAPGASDFTTTKTDELGLMAKFIIFFRGFFTGKSREELLREDGMKAIAHRIEQKYPGVIDRRRESILGNVAMELRELRDAARFFYDALDRSIERDRPTFLAFLGSIELPETHERLISETEPATIAASQLELRGNVEDSAVRNAALTAYEGIISELPDRGRRLMYQDLRSVLFLKRLSGFLFDRLIGAFKENVSSASNLAAPFGEVRELLLDLGDILFSMSEAPSIELMQAIFMFADREELEKPDEDAVAVLGADIAKAESSLEKIRSFNADVPLGDLLRLVSGDPGYLPRDLPGGEDWYAIYKAFWRDHIEADLDAWRAEHRNRELMEEISGFVGEPGPGGFSNISRKKSVNSPSLQSDVALVFLDAFYRGPFLRELNRPLKIILIDGEFYRKDNRVEFTDAYDALLRLPELLSTLDERLSPKGDIGISWHSAMHELGPVAVKRRKTQSITKIAEEEAEQIIRREGLALRTIVNIIHGFLKGEAGGRYDSLANISFIDGKSNRDFLRSLERAKDRCERAFSLLTELTDLDLSRDI